jgi:hypothetical protein
MIRINEKLASPLTGENEYSKVELFSDGGLSYFDRYDRPIVAPPLVKDWGRLKKWEGKRMKGFK